MKEILIPYNNSPTFVDDTYPNSVKVDPKVIEGVEGILQTFMNFTNNNELKSKLLTAITLKETGGTFCGRNPSAKSTAGGLMQCTRAALMDVLQDPFSKRILEDLIPAILRVDKRSINFDVDTIYELMIQKDTKAVGLAVGFAYFELNLKRYGKYPIVGVAAHYLLSFGKIVGSEIAYVRQAQNISDLIGRLNVLETIKLDKNVLSLTLVNNNNQYPSKYVMDVVSYFVSLLDGDHKKALSYIISSVDLYSGSAWANSITLVAKPFNLADYKKIPQAVVEAIKEVLIKNRISREEKRQLDIIIRNMKLDTVRDTPTTPQNTSVRRLVVGNYIKAKSALSRVYMTKKELFSQKPGESKLADSFSETKFILP